MCRSDKWFFSWLGSYVIILLFDPMIVNNVFLVGISLPIYTPYLHGYIFKGDKE
jgi:hypothetical protein